jgi:hypothetical protein
MKRPQLTLIFPLKVHYGIKTKESAQIFLKKYQAKPFVQVHRKFDKKSESNYRKILTETSHHFLRSGCV